MKKTTSIRAATPSSRLRTPTLAVVVVAALAVGAAPLAGRAQAQETGDGERIRARDVVKRMTDTLGAAQQLSFHAEIEFDDEPTPGLLVRLSGAVDASLRRSNGLRVRYRDEVSAKTVWFDGETLTLLDWDAGVFAAAEAAPTVDATLDRVEERYGVALPLSYLIADDAYPGLLKRAIKGTYLGIHDVEGVPCHHIAVLQENVDWELWVEAGPVAVPRKLLVRYKQERGSPIYQAVLMDWDLNAKLNDATFQAEIPKGAVPVEFLEIEGARR